MSFRKETVTARVASLMNELEIYDMDPNEAKDNLIAKVSFVSRDWQDLDKTGKRAATVFVIDSDMGNIEPKGGEHSRPYIHKFSLDIYGIFQSPKLATSTYTNYFMQAIIERIETWYESNDRKAVFWNLVEAGNGEDVFERYGFSVPAGTTCKVKYEFTIIYGKKWKYGV